MHCSLMHRLQTVAERCIRRIACRLHRHIRSSGEPVRGGISNATPRRHGARETVDGSSASREKEEISLPSSSPIALFAAARVCHPSRFQSSPIDPDSLTLPGRVLPEPGALHVRWPSVSIRSSSCHPVVTSTTPYRHRPSVRRVRPSLCLVPALSVSPRRGSLIRIFSGTREISGNRGHIGACYPPDPDGAVQSGFLNIAENEI
jgi:hypothetical protein